MAISEIEKRIDEFLESDALIHAVCCGSARAKTALRKMIREIADEEIEASARMLEATGYMAWDLKRRTTPPGQVVDCQEEAICRQHAALLRARIKPTEPIRRDGATLVEPAP